MSRQIAMLKRRRRKAVKDSKGNLIEDGKLEIERVTNKNVSLADITIDVDGSGKLKDESGVLKGTLKLKGTKEVKESTHVTFKYSGPLTDVNEAALNASSVLTEVACSFVPPELDEGDGEG